MRADRRTTLGVAVLAVAASMTGCTQIEDAMASVPFLNFMREAPFFDPYESPRPAPANSVPLASPAGEWESSIERPVTEAALLAFGDTLYNPMADTPELHARGQEVFLTYCSVCHGPQGEGNGPVVDPAAGKFPLGPSLTISTTVNRSDGYIYAIIKAGRGLMPPYQRIPPEDRWAVVSYLRQLQGQTAGQAQGQDQTRTGAESPQSGAAAGAAESQGQD